MAKTFALALLLSVTVILVPSRAWADNSWTTSSHIWSEMDQCTQEAQKKYPDYTAASNAKRERYRQLCLRQRNLPGAITPTPTPPQEPDRQQR